MGSDWAVLVEGVGDSLPRALGLATSSQRKSTHAGRLLQTLWVSPGPDV